MGDPKTKKAPTGYAPVATTALVMCEAQHKLPGLFVIFKLLGASDGSPAAQVARVIEGSPDPGAAPIEPAGPVPTGTEATDKRAKAKHDAAMKQYKKARAAYDEAKAKYDEAKGKYDDLPVDPASEFVCGFVDDEGFLQPVHAASSPWHDAATRRDPDTYKLSPGEKYKVYALRHPSPALARALTRFLNNKATEADNVYNFFAWGDWPALGMEITIEKVTTPGGDQGVMKIPESSDAYVPKGGSRYGGWVLYRDMPNAQCPGVAEQVEELQKDLGLLHFPVGGHGAPYDPRKNAGTRDQTLGAKPPKKHSVATVEIFAFDGQVQGCVARLHEHAKAGQAFVLAQKGKAQGGKHWLYVLGEPFSAAAHAALRWPAVDAVTPLGVVDDDTADLIAHWIDNGLAKPEEHLVPFDRWNWMLVRGAFALATWSIVAEAFGCKYGVVPGSSLRSVLVGAWPGAIKNSIHKTGLAVDLAGGPERFALSTWPIRYEASWKKPAKEPETDDGKLSWTQTWRIYGHSDLDVFGARAPALAALRQNLAALVGAAWPLDPATPADVTQGGLYKKLRKRFFDDDADPSVARWLSKTLAPFAAYVNQLLGASDAALVDQYFRSAVVQWHVNAYEGDGGSAGKIYKPAEGDGEFPSAAAWAAKNKASFEPRSWVNVSAIGYYCQMERLGPHRKDVRDQMWLSQNGLLDPKKPTPAPKPWSMKSYFTVQDDESADLVVMLHDITRSEAEAPDLKQRDTDVPIVRAGLTVATYKPADIDGDFVKEWREKALGFDAHFRPGSKKDGPYDPKGAQIAVILSADAGKRPALDKIVDALSGPFAGKRFAVMHTGSLTKWTVNQNPFLAAVIGGIYMPKGSDLATQLRAGIDDFTAQASARAREAEQREAEEKAAYDKAVADAKAAGKPPPKKPTKTKKQIADEKKAADEAAAKMKEDWTVVIQPVFVKKPDPELLTFLPEDSVVLPPGSVASHLEWWHYQHRSAGVWGPLLEECGYSRAVMGTPYSGLPDADAKPVHRGLGYTKSEIEGNPGGGDESGVENRDMFTPAGI